MSDTSEVTYAEVERLVKQADITTCTLVDVLDGLGVVSSVLPSGLQHFTDERTMAFGRAYTVSWVPVRKGPRIQEPSPSTWSEVRDFLVPEVTDGTGQIYVGGAGAVLTEAALAGGLSTTYFLEHLRFNAVVLGGAVRDRAVVGQLDRPVIASNIVPTDTQGAYRVHETGGSCLIGDVRITTGDWMFVDGNGAVVVADAQILEVLRIAAEIEDTERGIFARLAAGERLPDIIDIVGRI